MKKGQVPASVPAEPHLRKQLRSPAIAAAYLSYTAESDDPADFLYALRRVAEAHGGIGRIAKRANLNRQQQDSFRRRESGVPHAVRNSPRCRVRIARDPE